VLNIPPYNARFGLLGRITLECDVIGLLHIILLSHRVAALNNNNNNNNNNTVLYFFTCSFQHRLTDYKVARYKRETSQGTRKSLGGGGGGRGGKHRQHWH
jgi:hypothetical protein